MGEWQTYLYSKNWILSNLAHSTASSTEREAIMNGVSRDGLLLGQVSSVPVISSSQLQSGSNYLKVLWMAYITSDGGSLSNYVTSAFCNPTPNLSVLKLMERFGGSPHVLKECVEVSMRLCGLVTPPTLCAVAMSLSPIGAPPELEELYSGTSG